MLSQTFLLLLYSLLLTYFWSVLFRYGYADQTSIREEGSVAGADRLDYKAQTV